MRWILGFDIAARWPAEAMQALAQLHVRARHLLALALLTGVGAGAWLFAPAPEKVGVPIFDAISAVAWAGALAFLVLLGFLIFVVGELGRDELRALRAMRRALVVVGLSVALLAGSDQIRELGYSLMIGDGNWRRAFYLLVVLVFWALNNWHSARRGLWRATRPQDGRAPLTLDLSTDFIFWGPRLLGVCAHLWAAVSLAIAAWKQPEFGGGWTRFFAAPISVIVIAALTYRVYRFDHAHLSERKKDMSDADVATDLAKPDKSFWAFVVDVLRRSGVFLLTVSAILLIVAGAAYWALPQTLDGFVVGSLAISESAVIYLTVVSAVYYRKPLRAGIDPKLRDADDLREKRGFARWTWGLFLFCLPFVAWTVYDAPSVGRTFGSMTIALFTFGALLATINWVEDFTGVACRYFFADAAKPRVFGGYVTAGLLALCFLNAWMHPFHGIRPCEGGDCGQPGERMRVQRAAQIWYEQARAAYTHNGGGADDKVPMLIVATAGGGIRAAYWTAAVLDKLETDMAASGGARPYLFAISGVSGGSVGATAFSFALTARDKAQCDLRSDECTKATSYLDDDFFAPTLASWIFKDTLASFWLWPLEDRAAALEQGFEYSSNGLMGQSFLGSFNRVPAFDETSSRSNWRPILLLNATHEQSGNRIIASQVAVERDIFVDAFDELDVLNSDLRASTAAINSARFTYVSPAGGLGDKKGSLIDGGYYENYGALTALELARAAGLELGDKVRVVMLMITSDPTLAKTVGKEDIDKSATLVRIDQAGRNNPCVVSSTERDPARKTGFNLLPIDDQEVVNAWINEFTAPLQGITSVREAHGKRAAAELALQTCADYPKPDELPELRDRNANAGGGRLYQTQIAEALKVGRGVTPSQTEPARAQPDLPYFAHTGMCETDREGAIGFAAPLGWVLSEATRNGLKGLVARCGNKEQLVQLERALSVDKRKANR